MAKENPKLVISAGPYLMSKGVGEDTDPEVTRWQISSPIPGAQIINTWQIYINIWITLVRAENGKFNLYRSIGIRKPAIIHSHETKIYNLFFINDGHAIFCADDGWWRITKSGDIIEKIDFDGYPIASSAVVIRTAAKTWTIIAYSQDHKIYRCEVSVAGVEPTEWEEVYDSSEVIGRWYPAIAGCPAGVLAGASNYLVRSDDQGESFEVLRQVGGIIKNIVVSSNQTLTPVFMLVIEEGAIDKVYWTNDLGDSMEIDTRRVGTQISAQSVIPTGENDQATMFAILGKKGVDTNQVVRIVTGPG